MRTGPTTLVLVPHSQQQVRVSSSALSEHTGLKRSTLMVELFTRLPRPRPT